MRARSRFSCCRSRSSRLSGPRGSGSRCRDDEALVRASCTSNAGGPFHVEVARKDGSGRRRVATGPQPTGLRTAEGSPTSRTAGSTRSTRCGSASGVSLARTSRCARQPGRPAAGRCVRGRHAVLNVPAEGLAYRDRQGGRHAEAAPQARASGHDALVRVDLVRRPDPPLPGASVRLIRAARPRSRTAPRRGGSRG
jgi:hypothetical protein